MDDLRASFQSLRFPFDREPQHVTLSCGVAAYPGFDSPGALTEAADQTLYQAKTQSRNRVTLANP